MTDQSEITVSRHSTVYSGADAVELFRVKAVYLGLDMYNRTGMCLSRNAKPGQLLAIASSYSGRKYANNPAGRAQAIEDMRARHAALAASIPVTQK